MLLRRGGTLISIFLYLVVTILATESNETCGTYNIDLLRQLTGVMHRQQLQHLNGGPLLDEIDIFEPVYQFVGGEGAIFDRKMILKQLKQPICNSKQLTLYSTVFFKDSEDGGAVMEVSSMGVPLLGLYVYPMSHEIAFVYRHQGILRTEIFRFRMSRARVYKIAISVDGNQLMLHVNCEESGRRLIAIPDYCTLWEEPVVIVGGGNYSQEHRNRGTGFSGSMQLVGIHGGQNGLSVQCPDIGEINCPTCGQHLDRIEEVHRLRETINSLEQELVECNENLDEKCVGNSCLIDGFSFTDGELVQNRAGMICLCKDGNPNCMDISDIPEIPDNEMTTPPPDEDNTDNSDVPSCPPIFDIEVPEGGIDSFRNSENICTIIQCERRFGVLVPRSDEILCTDYFSHSCADNHTRFDREALHCCGLCSPCDGVTCPENMECIAQGQAAACKCLSGYELVNNVCEDRDECSLGNQVGGHDCIGLASCINTEGSFYCTCPEGYNRTTTAANFVDCEDIDECAAGLASCPTDANCTNTLRSPSNEHGYVCECPEGYELDTIENECQPICRGGCVNGDCVAPDDCVCHPGFSGSPCVDVDECLEETHDCNHVHELGVRMVCHNTFGGYFCACPNGFQVVIVDGESTCQDINECTEGLHNCPSSAECDNTFGSYSCGCFPADECRGACDTPGKRFDHGTTATVDCSECTCNNGEFSCKPLECNCGTEPDPMCCPDCYSPDMCPVLGSDPSLVLRIGETYIDPNDRCSISTCVAHAESGNARLETTVQQCGDLSCPSNRSYVPEGACCPVCELPECDNNEMSFTTSNCTVCTCVENRGWDCSSPEQCDPLTDCPKEYIFQARDRCCPVCKQTASTDPTCTV